MRKRRIGYVGALGLALAVAIPGSAMADGIQRVEAGYSSQANANIPIPAPNANLGNKFSKNGTLYVRLFLEDYLPSPSSAGVFDIHAPEELKFNTKGLDECNPASIQGQSADEAARICNKALIGRGSATAFLGPPPVPLLSGGVGLFNGTKQGGNSTVLFHSTAGTPITLVAQMLNSPLPGYGTLFRTLVAVSAGGSVPDGTPIVDTGFTNSKKYTDQKLAKKAKRTKKKAKKASGKKKKKLNRKAKKLKQKSKKSWVQARCTDGELRTRIEVSYVSGPPQSAESSQPCS